MASLPRRAFLQLSGLGLAALAYWRLTAGQVRAAARAALCVIMPGLAVPMAVPFAVGEDCMPAATETASPEPTSSPTLTKTATVTRTAPPSPTMTPSASPTVTGTPTATPTEPPHWHYWLPWMTR